MTERKTIDAEELLRAAESGERETVAALLNAGADVNACTPGGETALMRAAARGRAGVVRLLLERGADPNLRRQDNWTALMLAAFFDHTEAVSELVAGGADVLAADRNGSTALAWASSRGNVEAVRFLKDAVAVAEARLRARTAERAITRHERAAPVASEQAEPSRLVVGTMAPHAEVSTVSEVPSVKSEGGGNSESNVFAYADALLSAPVSTQMQTAAQAAEHREPGAFERAVKEKRTSSRLGRLAIYAAPLLLVVCGALAYKLFVISNSRDTGEGSRATQTPEAQQPVQTETQGQPVSPILNTPATEQLGESNEPGDITAPEVGTPATYPPGYANAPTYAPVETEPLRAPAAINQPPGRPAGGEPSVISLGQSEPSSEERRTTGQNARPAEEAPARDERRDAPRPSQQEASRASGATNTTPKPSPTPKPKVIPWP